MRRWDPIGSASSPPSFYHGSLSRAQAEALLTEPGDFLVRSSVGTPQSAPRNYVLSVVDSGGFSLITQHMHAPPPPNT